MDECDVIKELVRLAGNNCYVINLMALWAILNHFVHVAEVINQHLESYSSLDYCIKAINKEPIMNKLIEKILIKKFLSN